MFLQNMFERKNTSFYKIQINWIDQSFFYLWKIYLKEKIDQVSLKQHTDFMAQIVCKLSTKRHHSESKGVFRRDLMLPWKNKKKKKKS